MSDYLTKFSTVNTFVFDVDGVLAKEYLLVENNGDLLRYMNIRDGYALKVLAESDKYNVAVITGGKSDGVVTRLKRLGIEHVYGSIENKMEKFNEYVSENNIDIESTLYMGDDIPDYEIMKSVGIPVCPKNACKEIKDLSIYISHINGGEGCARDVIEQIMKCQGNWVV